MVGVVVDTDYAEGPVAIAILLLDGRQQREPVADLPTVLPHRFSADDGSIQRFTEGLHCTGSRLIFRVDLEEPVDFRGQDGDVLARTLILAAELHAESAGDDAWYGFQPGQGRIGQRLTERGAAAHVKPVGARGGDHSLDTTAEALKTTEQSERDDHLEQNQDGAAELAPDSCPYQRNELHARLPPLSMRSVYGARRPLSAARTGRPVPANRSLRRTVSDAWVI